MTGWNQVGITPLTLVSGLSPGRAEGAEFPSRFKGFCAVRLTARRLWVYIAAIAQFGMRNE